MIIVGDLPLHCCHTVVHGSTKMGIFSDGMCLHILSSVHFSIRKLNTLFVQCSSAEKYH